MLKSELKVEREKSIDRERLLIRHTTNPRIKLTKAPKSMISLEYGQKLPISDPRTPKVKSYLDIEKRKSSQIPTFNQKKSLSTFQLPFIPVELPKRPSNAEFLTPSARNRSQSKTIETNLNPFDFVTPRADIKLFRSGSKTSKNDESPLMGSHRPQIILDNIKKYDVTTPKASYKPEKVDKTYVKNLQNIINKHMKPIRPKRPRGFSSTQMLVNIDEVNLVAKKGMSAEDEFKINNLRKKINIHKGFDNLHSFEEKKEKFKEYIIEFHPDKGNHDKACCEEIFGFLQANKHKFLGQKV